MAEKAARHRERNRSALAAVSTRSCTAQVSGRASLCVTAGLVRGPSAIPSSCAFEPMRMNANERNGAVSSEDAMECAKTEKRAIKESPVFQAQVFTLLLIRVEGSTSNGLPCGLRDISPFFASHRLPMPNDFRREGLPYRHTASRAILVLRSTYGLRIPVLRPRERGFSCSSTSSSLTLKTCAPRRAKSSPPPERTPQRISPPPRPRLAMGLVVLPAAYSERRVSHPMPSQPARGHE